MKVYVHLSNPYTDLDEFKELVEGSVCRRNSSLKQVGILSFLLQFEEDRTDATHEEAIDFVSTLLDEGFEEKVEFRPC